ncbi:MAG: hypothetical protein HRU19_15295 [Pseudobacteriovorax sp.]|nr:hypothetical protein [Pseudobacteriovorax sp.]
MTNDDTKSGKLTGLWQWSMERFPVFHWIFAAVLFSGPYVWQHRFGSEQAGSDVLLFFTSFCFFLLLRVFDEHKDYELDCKNHPQRVLQRGVISLGDLKVLGIAAAIVTLLVTFLRGNEDAVGGLLWPAYVMTMLWAGLMAKEFFVGDWLETNLPLYGLSHMAIMFPLSLWFMTLTNPSLSNIGFLDVLVMGVNFFTGAIGEVARKTYAPSDERDGVDSYTKNFGVAGTTMILNAFSLILVAMTAIVIEGHYFSVLSVAALVFTILCNRSYRKQPTTEAAKKVENSHSLLLMANYTALLLGIGFL